MALEYLTFYQGNLATGFDYIYAKKVENHAFYINAPASLDAAIMDITAESFDFSQENQRNILIDKDLRQFSSVWQNITFQWPNIERQLELITADWQPEYQQQSPGPVKEWGLTVKWDNEEKPYQIIGYNDYPENFSQFVQWLNSYAGGKLR